MTPNEALEVFSRALIDEYESGIRFFAAQSVVEDRGKEWEAAKADRAAASNDLKQAVYEAAYGTSPVEAVEA